ncbi:MAG: hypothetical protein IJE49_04095 [Agathobacter sp.]|nr:hypothetical protein [Agathobacter sp.]
MTEKQKIKKILKEFRAIFRVTDMDVAESLKGEWFFSRYNKENHYYDVFTRFETAEELAEILLGELASDIYTTIDCAPEEAPSFYNFANDVEMKACYQPHIERLLEYLGK